MAWVWIGMGLAGCLSGLLAGLLGIGGGVVIVPALQALLSSHYVPLPHVMHVATSTSLATLFITTLVTTTIHNRKKHVVWRVVPWLLPATVSGVLLGVLFAHHINHAFLQQSFAWFCLTLGLYLIVFPGKISKAWLPSTVGKQVLVPASGAGFLSGLLGTSGNVLLIPILLRNGLSMVNASATASACAMITTFLGTLAAIWSGWQSSPPLPKGTLGFVYWPAALVIGIASSVCAPFGIRLAATLSAPTLKRLLGGLLCLLAWHMRG